MLYYYYVWEKSQLSQADEEYRRLYEGRYYYSWYIFHTNRYVVFKPDILNFHGNISSF
jgi:hypothetical protein